MANAGIHGVVGRHGVVAQRGPAAETGKFGRMFDLPPLAPRDDALTALGEAMVKDAEEPVGDNLTIPAGFTYLGQFIDHDITFDPTSLQEQLIDPDALHNFRSPALDLDSVYGGGPGTQPFLYRHSPDDGDLFEIGQTAPGKSLGDQELRALPPFPNDLPRMPNGLAVIADPRNDENLIVAQLHLAFLKFHNAVVRWLKADESRRRHPISKSVFEEARQLVVWHYQWIVVNDFLSKIVDDRVLRAELKKSETIFDSCTDPYMPIEFAMAAYRLGHSMVREVYDFNRVFRPGGVFPATLGLLFQFSGRSGNRQAGRAEPTPIPSDWIIDWTRFFKFGNAAPANLSRLMNTRLAPTLGRIPNVGNPNSTDPIERSNNLAVRNLIRGRRAGLPSGQAVAEYYGLQPLRSEEIGDATPEGQVARNHDLHIETPLWYYILKEAEIKANGQHLGPVGSRIVAQVFVGLLKQDRGSYLFRERGNNSWKPTLPGRGQRPVSSMVDLLAFVNDLNPLTSAQAADIHLPRLQDLHDDPELLAQLLAGWRDVRNENGESLSDFRAFRRHVRLATSRDEDDNPLEPVDIGDQQPLGF